MPDTVTILGAGESGVGAAKLCRALGMDCRVSDAGTIAPNRMSELQALGIQTEAGGHDRAMIE